MKQSPTGTTRSTCRNWQPLGRAACVMRAAAARHTCTCGSMEHRYYMSKRLGRDPGPDAAVSDYVPTGGQVHAPSPACCGSSGRQIIRGVLPSSAASPGLVRRSHAGYSVPSRRSCVAIAANGHSLVRLIMVECKQLAPRHQPRAPGRIESEHSSTVLVTSTARCLLSWSGTSTPWNRRCGGHLHRAARNSTPVIAPPGPLFLLGSD